MKVLITGDWHGDWVTDGYERFADVSAAAEQVVAEAIAQAVDLVIFDGDLSNPGTSRAHRAVELASRCARRLSDAVIKSLWLSGNHDVAEDGHGTATVGSIGAVPLAVVRTGPGADHYAFKGEKTLTVISLPFTPRSHAYDPAVEVMKAMSDVGEGEPVIVAGHLMVEGMGPGSVVDEFARGRDVFFPLVQVAELAKKCAVLAVNGHYHGGGECNGVQMPGAIARLAHGEEGNAPRFLVAEYKPGKGKQKPKWKVDLHLLEHPVLLITIQPPVDGPSEQNKAAAKGALVRVLPPAGFRQDAVMCEADLLAHGALAVKVMPPAPGVVVVGKREQGKRERVRHRTVVDGMVAEAHSRDRVALEALCGIVMDEERM